MRPFRITFTGENDVLLGIVVYANSKEELEKGMPMDGVISIVEV